MAQKRRRSHPAGPLMRPEGPAVSERIAAGVMRGMRVTGYDYPIRKLRSSAGTICVTLPLQVRGFLALERGDWLVFGATPWRGVAAFVKVTNQEYERIKAAGRKDFRRLARKVQGRKSSLYVGISQGTCEILSAEPGDFLHFSPWFERSIVLVSTIKGGDGLTGSRRMG